MPEKIDNFDFAFEELIGLEGGYVDDPSDYGGETKYGISKKQYPELDIKNLTLDQAKAIYKRDYWDKMSLDTVKDPDVALELFEQGVNFGIYWAGYHAQRALALLGYDLAIDGAIGPVTAGLLNAYGYPETLCKLLNGLQFTRYVDIVSNDPSQKRFFRGWLQRVVA